MLRVAVRITSIECHVVADPELDRDATSSAQDGFIVEKGEGIHTHVLRRKSPCAKKTMVKDIDDDVEIYQISDTMYIKVKKETIIDHEEHGKQTLKPGIYRKQIEREYDANSDQERRVRD